MAIMPFLSFACPPVAVLATSNPIPDIYYCGLRANKLIQIFRLSRQIIHLAIMPFIISSCHAAIVPYHYRDALFRFRHPLVFRPLPINHHLDASFRRRSQLPFPSLHRAFRPPPHLKPSSSASRASYFSGLSHRPPFRRGLLADLYEAQASSCSAPLFSAIMPYLPSSLTRLFVECFELFFFAFQAQTVFGYSAT